MKYCEKSIRQRCKTNGEIIRAIYDKMLSERQPNTVRYIPFTVYEGVDMIHKPGMDFTKVFPDFQAGDYVFITCDMDGVFEREMIYNVAGCRKAEVYFNGEKQELKPAVLDTLDAVVTFKKGPNRVFIKVVAEEGKFQAYVRPLVPGLRCGADDYVYHTRQCTLADGFKGQEGISYSRLYRKEERMPEITLEAIDWIFPVKPVQTEEKHFDFEKLCGNGSVAYVYTCVQGHFLLEHQSPLKIFSGKEVIYQAEVGQFDIVFAENTPLLIKSARGKDSWGFKVKEAEKCLIPFLEADDCPDLHWMWIGPFGRETEGIDNPYGPERNLFFHEPYPSICSNEVYWKCYREKTYLKQYLHTSFYGQWFYAMMVGLNGMRMAADKLHIEEFYDYFCGGMKLICNHRSYGKYDRDIFGWTSYMAKAYKLDNLDSIGTIGMNVAEYYLMSGDISAKYMLTLLADRVMHNIPRYEDGTYHRVTTMWTDDMYMCLSFLSRLAAITGEDIYFEEMIRQITGFYDRMFMEDQKIYSHIYFPQESVQNKIPWGRGNGWVLLAISEALLVMPEDYPNREKVLEIFRRFAVGVLEWRDKEEGIWHQVINNPESYVETSGSAMFITALARGIRKGWIEADCKQDVIDAWTALTDKCVDDEGNVYGVCMGSGCNKEEKYYMRLGTIINDDHGMGIVLGAGVEVMNLLGE